MGQGFHVVTGAYGYIGRRIARQLLDAGEEVRTITTHPEKPNPFEERIAAFPYDFDKPERLVSHLKGAEVLFNTYWIRFEHGSQTFEQALENTRILFESARKAGVGRVVHIGVTHAKLDDPLPYYAGKARQEELLRSAGVSYAIARPTLVFGQGDILVNNIAWLLRRFPIFPIFGSGEYWVQPVYIGDLARLCLRLARQDGDVARDAVGPESFSFEELVRQLARALDTRARFMHMPPSLGLALGKLIGWMVGDIMLTRDELRGLMREKLTSSDEPIGEIRFSDWIQEHADELGRSYASELERHFHWRPPESAHE